MSSRFVRKSSFRHVHGEAHKETFKDIRPLGVGDGDFITANTKFFAMPVVGGGGKTLVHKIDEPGRIGAGKCVATHKDKVLDQQFNPFNYTVLATGSADCSVNVVVLPEDGLTENISKPDAHMLGHTKKVTSIQWNPVANNILASGGFDHAVRIWDVECQEEKLHLMAGDGITDVKWNSNGSMLGVLSKDKMVRLYDPRTPDAVMEAKDHQGPKKGSLQWVDSLGLFVTVGSGKSANRSYHIWDPKKLGDGPVKANTIDNASGVLMSHFDPDTSMLYLSGKGSGSIQYYELNNTSDIMYKLSEFRGSGSHKGVGWLPKRCMNVAKCEVARALRVMRDSVIPVSFMVPRKSEMFQTDLFPDAYAGVSSVSNTDWLDGKNADPVKTSMEPGKQKGDVATKVVIKKSAAELQVELDAALARIKELEAQLAAK
jgi:WD40 repeat protein